jgi:hypothetical protein
MFELWKIVSPAEGSQKKVLEYILEGRCKHHDLGKFSPAEVLGYYYKFVYDVPEAGLITDTQTIQSQFWAQALNHHYCENDHHPYYWSLCSFPNVQKNARMPKAAMLESVFDMLACRVQRNLRALSDDKVVEVCPEQLMSIPQKYLEKFDGQIDEINLYLFDWIINLNDLMSEASEIWTALVKWQSDKGIFLLPRKYQNLTYQEALIETSWLEDWSNLIAAMNPQLPLDPLNPMNTEQSVILVDSKEQFDDSDGVGPNLNSNVEHFLLNEPVVLEHFQLLNT